MSAPSPNIIVCQKCSEIREEPSNIKGHVLYRCNLKKNKKIGTKDINGIVSSFTKILIPEGCKYELEHLVSAGEIKAT